MKKLITIAITIVALSAYSLLAKEIKINSTDQKVLDFNKKTIQRDPNVTLISQKLTNKEKLAKDWIAYTLDLKIKAKNRVINTPYFLFSNGNYLSTSMVNMNTGRWYGQDIIEKSRREQQKAKAKQAKMDFKLPDSYYNDEHFLYGNKAAKTKVVLFSDPMCVYCIKRAPKIMEQLKNRNDIAFYYYDFPLSFHPTTVTAMQVIQKAKEDGIKDVELKVYKGNLENFMNVYKNKDKQKTLDAMNKILKTNYKLADVELNKYDKHIKNDYKAGRKAKVTGTPYVLFNGNNYNSESKLKKFLAGK